MRCCPSIAAALYIKRKRTGASGDGRGPSKPGGSPRSSFKGHADAWVEEGGVKSGAAADALRGSLNSSDDALSASLPSGAVKAGGGAPERDVDPLATSPLGSEDPSKGRGTSSLASAPTWDPMIEVCRGAHPSPDRAIRACSDPSNR